MTAKKIAVKNKIFQNITFGLTALAGLSLAAGTALADDPTTMAPPIDGVSAPLGAGNAGINASADSVFNWQEIPASQQVPLTRATFDQGGYQLYDTVGETIVVPFTNQNLYVMKFAESRTGHLYFENEGGYPVLYVPKGGYLENATVAGARWFPLGENFHPAEPVFLGIAPSYTEFVNLGWYPDTCFYGGYYGHTSFISGGLFLPTIGLFFSIGGHPYYGWNSYHDYYRDHPGFSHVGYYNRDFYHFAGNHYREFAPDRHFGGDGGGFNHGGYNRGEGGDYHNFGDRSHTYVAHNGFGGQSGFGGVRTFRGAGSYGQGSHNYSVTHNSYTVNNYGGGHPFGSQNDSGQSGRAFRGASNYGGGQSYSGGRSYSGNAGGRSGGYSGHSFGGGQSFGGGHQDHAVPNSGGGHTFGGGRGGDGGGRR